MKDDLHEYLGKIEKTVFEPLCEYALKAEIKRVNQVLRETHNPREFKQNKKYLERLERKLRQCQPKK